MTDFTKDNPGRVFEVTVQRQITQEMRVNVWASNAKEAQESAKEMPKIQGKNGWTDLDATPAAVTGAEDLGPMEFKERRFRGRVQMVSTGRPAD